MARDHGVAGDGVTDDTAQIQALIDAANFSGGNVIWFGRGGYLLSQFVLKKGVYLAGPGLGGFGTIGTPYSMRLRQKVGANKSLIIYDQPEAGGRTYVGPCGISGMELVGSNTSTIGYGIELVTPDGRECSIQDTVAIHSLLVRGFPQGGMRLPQGAFPLHLRDIAFLWNGGPGVTYVHGDEGFTQAVQFDNISGDGNVGSLLYIDGSKSAGGPIIITNLKSEQRINVDYGGVEGQQNAIHLHNVRMPVIVQGVGHQSSTGSGIVPGPVIKITGDTINDTPPLVWEGVAVVTKVGDTGTSLVVDDQINSKQIVATATDGSYTLVADVRNLGLASGAWRFGLPNAPVPNIGDQFLSLAGIAPVISLFESDGPPDSKLWSIIASGGGLTFRTHTDTGEAGEIFINVSRSGTGVTLLDVLAGLKVEYLEVSTGSGGIVLRSPGGTRYRLTVDNAGVLSTTAT